MGTPVVKMFYCAQTGKHPFQFIISTLLECICEKKHFRSLFS